VAATVLYGALGAVFRAPYLLPGASGLAPFATASAAHAANNIVLAPAVWRLVKPFLPSRDAGVAALADQFVEERRAVLRDPAVDLDAVFPAAEPFPLNGLLGNDGFWGVLSSDEKTDALESELRSRGLRRTRRFDAAAALRMLVRRLGARVAVLSANVFGDHMAVPLPGGSNAERDAAWSQAVSLVGALSPKRSLFLFANENDMAGWSARRDALPVAIRDRVILVPALASLVAGSVVDGRSLSDALARLGRQASPEAVRATTVMILPGYSVTVPAGGGAAWLNGARLALLQTLTSYLPIETKQLRNLDRLARTLAAQA
jgi:hypothetical protein